MTLENATVLHAELLKVGRTNAAKDLERRYPELSKPSEPIPEPEVKKHGKKSKR